MLFACTNELHSVGAVRPDRIDDPGGMGAPSDTVPVSRGETSRRIAAALWNASPRRRLARPEPLAGQQSLSWGEAEGMVRAALDDARAAVGIGNFLSRWLDLDRLLDRGEYRDWDLRAREAMHAEIPALWSVRRPGGERHRDGVLGSQPVRSPTH
jgi:hypothetical protein